MLSFDELAQFFDRLLGANTYRDVRGRDGRADQNGIYRMTNRTVSRVALALEPWTDLEKVVRAGKIDALFLHRPWRLTAEQLKVLEDHDIGVLAYHLSFDEHLTLGFNPQLATVLDPAMSVEVLGFKDARPLGMLCTPPVAEDAIHVLNRLRELFKGLELVHSSTPQSDIIRKIAVVGAMNDALVREAHACGAGVYVTGQWRQPAASAVSDTAMTVVVVGHLRSEVWGLHFLAKAIRNDLHVNVSVHEPM